MKYWNLFKTIAPWLCILLCFLLVRSCVNSKEEGNRHADNIKALNSEMRTVKLKSGELSNEKDLLTVTNKELRDQVYMKDDTIKDLLRKIKDPVVVVKWKTKFVLDTIFIGFDTPVDHKFTRSFSRNEEWYNVSGIVTQNGISFGEISFPNEQRMVVGYKKGKPIVSITNSNPFIQTETIQGQVIEVPKRRFVVAAGVGYNYFQDPYFGIFAGYKLFQF